MSSLSCFIIFGMNILNIEHVICYIIKLYIFQLHLVGVLKDYEIQSTKATYKIEDHTGVIKAIWWLENDSDNVPNLPPVKEGNYVQVFGSLRNQDGEKFVMVLRMFLVEDCNVITSHLLQVIHTRLAAEKLSKTSVSMNIIIIFFMYEFFFVAQFCLL